VPISLFQELDSIAIAAPVQKGSFVFSSGDPTSAVYVVRSGKIALLWAAAQNAYPFDAFGPATVLGLPSALNGFYSATARAVEDSVLGFIPADRVLDMLERNPSLMHATLKLVALEVARMREMIATVFDDGKLHLSGKPIS
jgi:CRP-like cAMP-binding protein